MNNNIGSQPCCSIMLALILFLLYCNNLFFFYFNNIVVFFLSKRGNGRYDADNENCLPEERNIPMSKKCP